MKNVNNRIKNMQILAFLKYKKGAIDIQQMDTMTPST
jgi:hypothetical protein